MVAIGQTETRHLTSTPKSSLRRQASFVVFGDAISVASTVIGTMVLARVLSKGEMGTWQQVLYVTLLLSGLIELGVGATVYRFWSAFEGRKHKLYSYAKMVTLVTFGLGGIASFTLLLSAPIVAKVYENPVLSKALFFASLTPLGTIPFRAVRPVLISRGFSLKATCLETLFAIATTGSLVLACVYDLELYVGIGLRAVVGIAFALILPYILYCELRTQSSWWDVGVGREVWRYLWPIQVARIPGMVIQYADKVVMSVVTGPQAFAVYCLGAREVPFIGKIGNSISSVLIPRIVSDVESGNICQLKRRWSRACYSTALVTYPVGAICLFYPAEVMRLFFSGEYSQSGIPFQVFSLLTFVRVVEYASIAKAINRSDIIMKSSVLACCTMLGLAFPFTYWFRGVGMALCLVASNCVAVAYFLFQYNAAIPGKIRELFPWHKLIAVAMAACFAAGCSRVVASSVLLIHEEARFAALLGKLSVVSALIGLIYGIILNGIGFATFPWQFNRLPTIK